MTLRLPDPAEPRAPSAAAGYMRLMAVRTSAGPRRRVAVHQPLSVGLRTPSFTSSPDKDFDGAPGETRTPNLLIRRPPRRVRKSVLEADVSANPAGRRRPDPARSTTIRRGWLPDWLPARTVACVPDLQAAECLGLTMILPLASATVSAIAPYQ